MKKQLTVLLPLILVAAPLSGSITLSARISPLTDAAEKGDVEAVGKLIAKGADVNKLDKLSHTPLHVAASKEVAELLIAKGADINATNANDLTPLHYAAASGNKEVAELLIANGADVNAKEHDGRTPLHMTIPLFIPIISYQDIVKLLIDKGADISIRDHLGKTPRMYAEERNRPEIARLLKEAEEEGPKRVEAAVDPQEEATFTKAAQDYHDADTKPMLPEEARKFKVQAEQLVGDKKFDQAAELYKKALAIAPWWPEGHFNRAIVLGETRYYQDAIRELKRYLILVPNALDARAAQDKIYAWELKAGK